ncbi:hypothetical protein MAIT1_01171 [Magnetofaba australis IT-1]|uniref:Putative heavy-metal chelation domain-containing protein n=1 Tax=Magnetofaba australis IT-1 TaxID=1434232 RepID=A0A1Y2K7B6_9PROT|nr:hypothetical protein MAIT1_01171 [Magnetofaba australis IT-1]
MVGMAACNCALNVNNPLSAEAVPLTEGPSANLLVFEHFQSRLRGKRVAVVGRYPGLDRYAAEGQWHVLERQPGPGDLPDTAAEYLLPQVDWAFITASALVNKSLPRLLELARDAVTVLMGPTTPWLPQWRDYGVDFLAGVRIANRDGVHQAACEGGGVRLFECGAEYALQDIGADNMTNVKAQIAQTFAQRDGLKSEMEAWYAQHGAKPFVKKGELQALDAHLSRLDTCYKRQWDARNG